MGNGRLFILSVKQDFVLLSDNGIVAARMPTHTSQVLIPLDIYVL